MDDTRLELVTSRTSSGCATSCANRPSAWIEYTRFAALSSPFPRKCEKIFFAIALACPTGDGGYGLSRRPLRHRRPHRPSVRTGAHPSPPEGEARYAGDTPKTPFRGGKAALTTSSWRRRSRRTCACLGRFAMTRGAAQNPSVTGASAGDTSPFRGGKGAKGGRLIAAPTGRQTFKQEKTRRPLPRGRSRHLCVIPSEACDSP